MEKRAGVIFILNVRTVDQEPTHLTIILVIIVQLEILHQGMTKDHVRNALLVNQVSIQQIHAISALLANSVHPKPHHRVLPVQLEPMHRDMN